jgi:hypothetical protein
MKVATRSTRRSLPCSISIITLVVVATTLVREATSNIVSSVIARPTAPAPGCRSLLINDAVADANHDDGARQAFLADLLANQRLDRVELADVEAGGGRPLLTRRERHAVRGSRQDEGDGGGCKPGEAICHGLRTARG